MKAYQYTSLTSVMLLDCWTIPSVMFLTWMFLKTKYRLRKFVGVIVCVVGLVMVVFSDAHSKDRSGNHNIWYWFFLRSDIVTYNTIYIFQVFCVNSGPCLFYFVTIIRNYCYLEQNHISFLLLAQVQGSFCFIFLLLLYYN